MMTPPIRTSSRGLRQSIVDIRVAITADMPNDVRAVLHAANADAELAALGIIAFTYRRWRTIRLSQRIRMRDWLLASSAEELRPVLDWALGWVENHWRRPQLRAFRAKFSKSGGDVYEQLVAKYDSQFRRRTGLYCTPWALARFAVERADRALGLAFGDSRGILSNRVLGRNADQQSATIVDPAVGTGVFPCAMLLHAARRWRSERTAPRISGNWSAWLESDFLPRVFACDIQAGPLVCGLIRLACALRHTGYTFSHEVALGWRRCDWLETLPALNTSRGECPAVGEDPFSGGPVALLIGNPPYGAIHGQATPAMRALMHGEYEGAAGTADYFRTAAGPLGERKIWLYDAYVQFMRLAHWQLALSGGGVMAFVTNRGFMRHITMRGLRYQWLQAFDRIELHDFEGGGHRSPSEGSATAENVFGIRSGIALSVLSLNPTVRPVQPRKTPRVQLRVHAGIAADKLDRLRAGWRRSCRRFSFVPTPPLYSFEGTASQIRQARVDFRLDECFELQSSAVVTARDGLVVATDRKELLTRIEWLRDSSLSDDWFRDRFFARSRGHKYPRGDTRGWKLAEARSILAADPDWSSHVRRCNYRPLDDRYLFWHAAMIDWRREKVTSLMLDGMNPALVARRQAPAADAVAYFWVTRWPTLDGIIRSDNRGNESVFPLWRDAAGTSPNLTPRFVESATDLLRLKYRPVEKIDLVEGPAVAADSTEVTSLELFAFLVALVFSDSYRARHAADSQHGFVPIGLVRDVDSFRELARHGRRLIRLIAWHDARPDEEAQEPNAVQRESIGKPIYDGGHIRAGETLLLSGVDENVWTTRVGSHQVCRKWLADRRGQRLTPEIRRRYAQVCLAVEQIRRECQRLEATVLKSGGWPKLLQNSRL